jgi:glucarate dehydratase
VLTTGRVVDVRVTPLAFADPPLLNADGVHEPFALRSLVEIEVEAGTGGTVIGVGEGTGHAWQLDWLGLAGTAMAGGSVFDTGLIRGLVERALSGEAASDLGPDAPWRRWADRTEPPESRGPAPIPASAFDVMRVYSQLEVACLDAQGKLLGLPVVDLLGGALRRQIPYSGYLFYKWAEHPAMAGRPAIPDRWGEALDPDGIVRQARMMVDTYGFRSLKLKGGVMDPEQEVDAILALRTAFPDHPLRLDPNAVWSTETALAVAERLEGALEYLEDPVAGMAAMAAVAARTTIPLATNMCVTRLADVRPAVRSDAVAIVLADHHYWGGLRGTTDLSAVCQAAGFGLSMHSNSHLGVSLAAMTHAAAAVRTLSYACDTHYPWSADDDIVLPGVLRFVDGCVRVPEGPGLGVELDPGVVGRLHAQYLALGREHRNDAAYARAAGAITGR